MLTHKATLIQDITQYLLVLREYLQPVLTNYPHYNHTPEADVIKWIIEEELELGWHLFASRHIHNAYPHHYIHNLVSASMPMPLTNYSQFYLLAPQLYGDHNEISIRLDRNDLYIHYYGDAHLPFPTIAINPNK
jgi:hypothetical protein